MGQVKVQCLYLLLLLCILVLLYQNSMKTCKRQENNRNYQRLIINELQKWSQIYKFNLKTLKMSQHNNQPSQSPQNPQKPNLLSPGFIAGQNQIVYTAGKVGKSHHQYLKVMAEEKGVNNYRKITMEQLAQHKTKQSAWLSLGGIVYDVTVYLNYHPGGSILLEGCGKECSQLFNQHHPWVNAKYLLEKYKIGFLGR